jgi:hypothetical protein
MSQQGSRMCCGLSTTSPLITGPPCEPRTPSKHVRNRAPPWSDRRAICRIAARLACLQACRSGAEKLPSSRWSQPVAKTDARCEIRRWVGGHRSAGPISPQPPPPDQSGRHQIGDSSATAALPSLCSSLSRLTISARATGSSRCRRIFRLPKAPSRSSCCHSLRRSFTTV